MQEAENQSYGLSRLIGFSDDIFAFAITLLIIIFPFRPVGAILTKKYDVPYNYQNCVRIVWLTDSNEPG